jgi:hypothetical protein
LNKYSLSVARFWLVSTALKKLILSVIVCFLIAFGEGENFLNSLPFFLCHFVPTVLIMVFLLNISLSVYVYSSKTLLSYILIYRSTIIFFVSLVFGTYFINLTVINRALLNVLLSKSYIFVRS